MSFKVQQNKVLAQISQGELAQTSLQMFAENRVRPFTYA